MYPGKPIKRVEDPRLITGRGHYVDDVKTPGILHAAFVRSPYAHARVGPVDTAEARGSPGVVAVLTAQDIAGTLKDLPARTFGDDWIRRATVNSPLHPVLARDRVCYVGQPVAVVVAESRYLARDAAETIRVDYEPLFTVMDALDAMEPGAPVVHPHIGTNIGMRASHTAGNVQEAFSSAHHVVRQRYHVQRVAPMPMETRGILADYAPDTDLLTVWDSTQVPHRIKAELAKALGRAEAGVRVIAPDVGGGFGEKLGFYPEEASVAYLSIQLSRPVKWIADRQENMLGFHARDHHIDMEVAVDREGIILGVRIRIVADVGAYFTPGSPMVPVIAGQRMLGPYKVPCLAVEMLSVVTNKPTSGVYRGAGAPEGAFCTERTMDLIASDLGLDPAEVRRRNFIHSAEFPYKTITGLTYDSGDYHKVFDRALEMSDYYGWRERTMHGESGGKLVGMGIATVVKQAGASGPTRTEVANLKVSPTGEVTAYTGVSPHGQGTETTFAQVVADELGISNTGVTVVHGDTALVPSGGGSGASRGVIVGANAMLLAAREMRRRLSQASAKLLGCPVEEVAFQNGAVHDRRVPHRGIPFPQVAAAFCKAEGQTLGVMVTSSYTLPEATFSFGAHVAVVELDPDTGDVKIVKYVAVQDSGRIINPLLASGQYHGGIAQGLGQALTENVLYTRDGQPLSGSLMDYAVPVAETLPDLELDTVETPSPTNPLGAKGVGELPTLAAPVVIANAVMDALKPYGVRHIDTPLTPEKVLRAIQSARSSGTPR